MVKDGQSSVARGWHDYYQINWSVRKWENEKNRKRRKNHNTVLAWIIWSCCDNNSWIALRVSLATGTILSTQEALWFHIPQLIDSFSSDANPPSSRLNRLVNRKKKKRYQQRTNKWEYPMEYKCWSVDNNNFYWVEKFGIRIIDGNGNSSRYNSTYYETTG